MTRSHTAPRAAAVAALIASLCLASHAFSIDRYVAACGNDAWSGTLINCIGPFGPKRTIQAAIAMAFDGDVIHVLPGTYEGNLDFEGKAITLRSTGGAGVTTIVPSAMGAIVRCESGEGADTAIEGFTIRFGESNDYGAGLRCVGGSPSVTDCVFAQNDADLGGGAVYVEEASPTFAGCTFTANRAAPFGGNGHGGAIYVESGAPSFSSCEFAENSASLRGGAAYLWIGAHASFDNTLFAGNETWLPSNQSEGGAIASFQGHVTLDLCTFEENSTSQEGGAISTFAGSISAIGCDFFDNEAVAMSGGAVRAATSATLEFLGCEFTGNRSGFYGAAITAVSSDLSVVLCGFHDNGAIGSGSTERGGALWASYCGLDLGLSTFTGNVANVDGGAVTISGWHESSSTTITACVFSGNSAGENGGGVSLANGSGTITNCTFANNHAEWGGGLHTDRFAADPDAVGAFATVTGCTFEQCTAFIGAGADINASALLDDCTFVDNEADWVGGGASVGFDGTFEVRGSSFSGNVALSGGGMTVSGDDCLTRSCTFTDNIAQTGGALISTFTGTTPTVHACAFTNNQASDGGAAIGVGSGAGLRLLNSVVAKNDAGANLAAVWLASGTIDVINCTVANNVGGGILAGEFASMARVSNSIVWGNTSGAEVAGDAITVRYSNVQGGAPGIGNLNANPKFLGALVGNYRVQSTSPCIDAGMNWLVAPDLSDLDADGLTNELTPVDFDGLPRLADSLAMANAGCGVNAIVDMGPFEAVGRASVDVIVADLDGDGAVNGSDLAILLGDWGSDGACLAADLNGDGTIDGGDLGVLLGAWTF
jgi:hypothetical protein